MATDHNGPPISLCIIVTHPHLTSLLFVAFNVDDHVTCLLVSLLSSSWPRRAGLGFDLCSVKNHASLLEWPWPISDTWIGESCLLLPFWFAPCQVLKNKMSEPWLCWLTPPKYTIWMPPWRLSLEWPLGTVEQVFKPLGWYFLHRWLGLAFSVSFPFPNVPCSKTSCSFLSIQVPAYSLAVKYLQKSKQTLSPVRRNCWRTIPLWLGLATVVSILLFLVICHMMPVNEAHETPWLPLGKSQPSMKINNQEGAEHSAENTAPPTTLLESSQ